MFTIGISITKGGTILVVLKRVVAENRGNRYNAYRFTGCAIASGPHASDAYGLIGHANCCLYTIVFASDNYEDLGL